MLLSLLLACASEDIAWAVNHASVVPDASGLTGTQTWEFFTKGWTPDSGDKHFACARAQTLDGAVASAPECKACTVVYTIAYEEIDSDCSDDYASDRSYQSLISFGIGDVDPDLAADDPHPDHSFGWYVSVDGSTMEPFGWAWDEAFNYDGDPGPPGWVEGRAYTLWPAVAWEL
jgi:hypothetical protein